MANTTNNVNAQAQNPMKVITGPDTRWSYANVWEAKSINGGTPKFSVSLIIPKSDTKTIAKIKAAIEAAYREGEAKLKGNGKTVPPLAALKTPLRDGDTERPDDPAYNNAYFINANSATAPGVVDADRQEIINRSEVYSGVYGRASINDEDALRQAYEFCDGEVVLLELFQLDEDYNIIRSVEITPRTDRLTIEIPLDGFTPEKLDNLSKLVNAKASLLKASLGTDDLPIKQTAGTLQFPWFKGTIDAEHTEAYATLISLLCKTAIEKKRITAREKDIDGNPKYAMRCFLLSLGFIGDEYKAARKVLLSRLEGNSSWKGSKKMEVADSE